jgi:hypothetical protein
MVCAGCFEEVAEVVKFVAVVSLELPACLAGPGVGVLRVDRSRRVQVTIGLLRGGDLRDEVVDVRLEFRVGVHGERVGGALDHLVGIGVVEGVARRLRVRERLAAQRGRGADEVVDAAREFALLEREGDADQPVGLDLRRPELVVEVDGREGHRLHGVVAACAPGLLRCAASGRDQTRTRSRGERASGRAMSPHCGPGRGGIRQRRLAQALPGRGGR